MYIDSRGIVLRQIKTQDTRTMLLVFTEKYGKLSVGTGLTGKGKNKSSLALRPFTFGMYHIFKGRNYYNLDRAETLHSFYSIGEDIDKYMEASYILELTEKVIPEDVPQPGIFSLLMNFIKALEKRKTHHLTLKLAYEVKLLKLLGIFPELKRCAICGSTEGKEYFSIESGGLMCSGCCEKIKSESTESLIFPTTFDIVKVLNYFASNSLETFEKIALEDKTAKYLQRIIRSYISYHLDIKKLKSESVFDVEI
ncbi:MAG: DNA repair protein RecO [Hornefia sp.]|nr:DNA repair protein RecO [Hornefia sp.]